MSLMLKKPITELTTASVKQPIRKGCQMASMPFINQFMLSSKLNSVTGVFNSTVPNLYAK